MQVFFVIYRKIFYLKHRRPPLQNKKMSAFGKTEYGHLAKKAQSKKKRAQKMPQSAFCRNKTEPTEADFAESLIKTSVTKQKADYLRIFPPFFKIILGKLSLWL